MFSNISLFFLWSILTYAVFLALPDYEARARQYLLIISSLLLIYMVAPWSALVVILVSILGYLWCQHHEVFPDKYKILFVFLTILAPLIAIKLSFGILGRDGFGFGYLMLSLGVGFYSLKTIATVIDCIQGRAPVDLPTFLLLNVFFPIYSAGPIERSETFEKITFKRSDALPLFFDGTQRVLVGLLKAVFIADVLVGGALKTHWPNIATDMTNHSTASLLLFIFMKFIYTYVNFSGYMDIVIGISNWFGFRIMENFNFPIIAGNIQQFWQRWHISLGDFTKKYIFFPLLLTLNIKWRAQVAIFLAFMLIGIWHEFSWNYFAWGVLHGFGLAMATTLNDIKNTSFKRIRKMFSYRAAAWALTIFYVSYIQTIANMPNIQSAWLLTKTLAWPW